MRTGPLSSRWVQGAVLALVCVLVYWLLLGARPLEASEGHRAVPGWTMLRTGEWWRVQMFGQTYLRKPPGMPWAIGGASAVLGETEFAARSVSALSATAMTLVAFLFATRWFGSPFGFYAGLAQALTPLFWSPGRSAEIESLNTLGAQLACLGLIELLARPRPGADAHGSAVASEPDALRVPASALSPVVEPGLRAPTRVADLVCTLVVAVGVVGAALAKGPAGASAIAGVLIGACLAARSLRPLTRPWPWAAFALAAGALFPIGLRILRANSDPGAITQDPGDFRWTRPALEIAGLPLVAFAAALPTSLALLFPLGSDARREPGADRSPHGARAWLAARALVFGWIAAVVLTAAAGIGNPRYVMPAAALLPPLVAYVARGAWRFDSPFTPLRRRIARALAFRNPLAWPTLLVIAAVLGAFGVSKRRDVASGPDAGAAIARAAGAGAIVWADDLIEARPDALHYAERAAAGLRVRWQKGPMAAGLLPGPGEHLLLRTDGGSGERARYAPSIAGGSLVRVGGGAVGRYTFEVYRRER